jgi:hypothetical protein
MARCAALHARLTGVPSIKDARAGERGELEHDGVVVAAGAR